MRGLIAQQSLQALCWASLLAAGLTGCSSESTATSKSTNPSPGPAAPPSGSAPESGDCLAVPRAVLTQLEVGERPGTTLRLAAGAAVRAANGTYVVAAQVRDVPGERGVGVWTVVSLKGVVAPILVADANASSYSTWVTVEEFPQWGVALDSPAIPAARDCLAG